MTRKYALVIENHVSGYRAYVPEYPAILVTGETLEQISSRAADAIRSYCAGVVMKCSPTAILRDIEVDLPL